MDKSNLFPSARKTDDSKDFPHIDTGATEEEKELPVETPSELPPSPLLQEEPRKCLTPEQVLKVYGTVYDGLRVDQLDALLAFEFGPSLNEAENMYKLNRDQLAFRVAVMANKACHNVVLDERDRCRLHTEDLLREARKEHARDLAEEKQWRNNQKANMRSMDFR
jgi:hypothetical protein